MIKHILSFVFCLSLTYCAYARDAEPRPARFDIALFSPEVVMRYANELGLDETQKMAIHEEVEKSHQKLGDLQATLQQEMIALNEFLQQNAPDETKALAQLDKVLDAERAIKHAHLSLVLAVRGKLTPEQQAKMRGMQDKILAEARDRTGGPPEALKEKMQRLQELFARAHQDGRDVSAIAPLMQEIQGQLHQGNFKEVEALMDKALKALEEGQKK